MRRADPETLKRSLLAAATKGHASTVAALVPHCVFDDRALALVASCNAGHTDAATALMETLPGRYLGLSLSACASKGLDEILREILASGNAADIEPSAVCHARSLARAKEHWELADALTEHIYAHCPEEDDDVGSANEHADSSLVAASSRSWRTAAPTILPRIT